MGEVYFYLRLWSSHGTYEKTVGEILVDDRLKDQLTSVMREAAALARGLGVALPEDIVNVSVAKGNNFPYETKTSFQRDFERMDKPDERKLLRVPCWRFGARLNIDTPQTRELHEILNRKKPIFWEETQDLAAGSIYFPVSPK